VNFENEDDYVCKAANTVQEARELIEVGFEYTCEIDYTKLFRERKQSMNSCLEAGDGN
jgi:hypothetical protein